MSPPHGAVHYCETWLSGSPIPGPYQSLDQNNARLRVALTHVVLFPHTRGSCAQKLVEKSYHACCSSHARPASRSTAPASRWSVHLTARLRGRNGWRVLYRSRSALRV